MAVGAAAATLSLGFWASKAFYTVKDVIDGDTFVTTENQIIRLDSVNAPEPGNCFSKESKDELTKLVLHKKVYLKVVYINGMRLIASVYTTDGNVGAKMLSKGLATYTTKSKWDQSILSKASDEARNKKIGIYSSVCTQLKNTENPKCNIKGNIRDGRYFYRTPNCSFYNKTEVQLYLGDRWFCSKSEAIKAGFTKGSDCP